MFFGWLSDRIGRKPIILSGCALAAVIYFPLFGALTNAANPALAAAQSESPVTVYADPASCSVQFDPIGKTKFDKCRRHAVDALAVDVVREPPLLRPTALRNAQVRRIVERVALERLARLLVQRIAGNGDLSSASADR